MSCIENVFIYLSSNEDEEEEEKIKINGDKPIVTINLTTTITNIK